MAEIALYITGELKLNSPNPTPVFQIKSKFKNVFIKRALSLNLSIISIFEYLSNKKISRIIIKDIKFTLFKSKFFFH